MKKKKKKNLSLSLYFIFICLLLLLLLLQCSFKLLISVCTSFLSRISLFPISLFLFPISYFPISLIPISCFRFLFSSYLLPSNIYYLSIIYSLSFSFSILFYSSFFHINYIYFSLSILSIFIIHHVPVATANPTSQSPFLMAYPEKRKALPNTVPAIKLGLDPFLAPNTAPTPIRAAILHELQKINLLF